MNNGRYQLRVVTSVPDWVADDGEMLCYHDVVNDVKYLFIYIIDDWHSVRFTGGTGAEDKLHHIGEIFLWGGSDTDTSVIPPGCIICNGAAVPRSTYSALYDIVGTNFGSGDGSTTFNVPDYRGRFPLGKDDMGGTSANIATDTEADSIGGMAGNEAGIATHAHSNTSRPTGAIAGAPNATHSEGTTTAVTTGSAGTTTGNMPPYQTVNYLIQA